MRCLFISFTCLCLIMATSFAMAKEDKSSHRTDPQAMMDMYKKVATPGEPHKQLASLAGSWATKTKSWVDPNKAPMESTGACEQKMLLGGRFLQDDGTTVHGHRRHRL